MPRASVAEPTYAESLLILEEFVARMAAIVSGEQTPEAEHELQRTLMATLLYYKDHHAQFDTVGRCH